MHAGPGQYHGFFWFYFFNEQMLRFLNPRYPRDYNTVPRALVLALPSAVAVSLERVFACARSSFTSGGPAGRARLLACAGSGSCCFSSPSLPPRNIIRCPFTPRWRCCWRARWRVKLDSPGAQESFQSLLPVPLLRSLRFVSVRGLPTPGDISSALTQNADAYTLSLGHMHDLTLKSFAYLRLPLVIAGIAFVIGAVGAWRLRGEHALLAMAVMMVIFFQAARLALVTFDPYLSSVPSRRPSSARPGTTGHLR